MSRATGNKTDTRLIRNWEWELLEPELPEHWRVFYELLLQTGIRAFDALKITTRDLQDYGVYVTTGKGKYKTRKLMTITATLFYQMQELARKQRTVRVFPYTTAAAWAALKLAARKSGVRETIHPNSFRHGMEHQEKKQASGHLEILKEILGNMKNEI